MLPFTVGEADGRPGQCPGVLTVGADKRRRGRSRDAAVHGWRRRRTPGPSPGVLTVGADKRRL